MRIKIQLHSSLSPPRIVAVILCACLISSIAEAQTSPIGAGKVTTAASASATDQLGEVVVTAERRVSTVQATPMSITAITGATLEARGLTNVEAVAEETPGISFRTAGPAQTEYEMRGISSTGGSVGTVGFYLDDTPITPPSFGGIGKVVIDPDLYDLKSVEVLRGPQGTLYGAGSMGGTIRLLTNSPALNELDASVQGIASFTKGGGFNRGGSLMLNIPVVKDLLAFRFVASSKFRDGWLDRIVVNPFPFPSPAGCPPSIFTGCVRGDVTTGPFSHVISRVNWERLNTVRPSLLIAPSDNLEITIKGLYQDTKLGGYDNIDIPPGCDSGILCGHYQPFDVAEPLSDTVKLLSVNLRYDSPVASLTSVSSYWTRDETQTQDASEAIESILGPPYVALPYVETDHSEQFSQEMRVASEGAGRLKWLGGLFYSNFQFGWYQSTANEAYADLSPGGLLVTTTFPYDTKEYAAFAEASYNITPSWKFTAGLREFRYRSDANYYQSGLFAPFGPGIPFFEAIETSDHGLSPKFNLAYIPTDDLTVYGTAAKGFRPGGIDEPMPVTGPATCLPSLQAIGYTGNRTAYGPDSLWDYEVGEKARLLNRKFTVNSDVFYMRWSGIQQIIPLSCGYLLAANAGDARSYGSEIELQAEVARGLKINVNGAYTNAAINRPASFLGVAPGQPLLNVPKYTASAQLEYTRPLTDRLILTANASESIIGPQWDVAYAMEQLPSYALTDVRFGVSGDRWTATTFVSNLTNKQAIQTINNTFFTENIPSLTRASVNQPRTIGLQIDWRLH